MGTWTFRSLLLSVALALAAAPAAPQARDAARAALIARAKAVELDTAYVPPPGEALTHHTSGFAKVMCSAVFITGLDPNFAAANVGYFVSPPAERAKVGKPVIDRAGKAVHVMLPNGVRRTARYLGDQGCLTLPVGKESVSFTPVRVERRLPDPATQRWPMGDVLSTDPLPAEVDATKVKRAMDAAFEPAASMTAAFVVTWRGRPAPRLRRLLLDQRRRRLPRTQGRVLHGRGGRPDCADRAFERSRGGAAGALQGQRTRDGEFQPGARPADGGGP
jgi:hypothetical protein